MSMAFRGQPQYAQSPMGGYNMSGYGGDAMQALGDIGGFGGFGALSGPATMGGNYSMFGSYNPMPYQQQSYTGGYVPGYGAQLPQQFGGGYGQGYGNMYGGGFGGGYGGGFGGFGMPQMQQPNVNDLFGQYMFGQYYGQPSFNPFQATSMFGGGRRGGGGFGGGFGGARRGSRQQFQPPAANAPQRPSTPITYDTMRPVPRIFEPPAPIPTPAPAPAPAPVDNNSSSADWWFNEFRRSGSTLDDAALRDVAEQRAALFRTPAPTPAPAPVNAPNTTLPLYSIANDNWGMDLPFDYTKVPSSFNWQAYLDAPGNADLRAAGVDTPSEAAKHYLNYGMNENRSLGEPVAQPAAPTPTPTPTPAMTQPYTPYDPYMAQPYYPQQQIEQALPYSFGSIDMGALPMFVDSYSGLYNNPFSFR